MNRWSDWWDQAVRDLAHARNAAADADFEWSAFAAQQAAEKAAKALVLALGGDHPGHSVARMLETLDQTGVDDSIVEAGLRLDNPNGLPPAILGREYTLGEAEKAIEDASTILEFCRSHLPRP